MSLLSKTCVPVPSDTPAIRGGDIPNYLEQLQQDWHVVGGKSIEHEFQFPDFVAAMAFVNGVAELAEDQQHHPDIQILYNKVKIGLWTHSVEGLSENDFIMAAKVEDLL